ncbi:4Fe-4S dicluster domain-containing protein [Adlercreutzia aquisgranensis]|uniref:4Fe-4S dicluster domain-containing protein n=1 Tax=Adlercreutzia aquisgranensis TaxID=2941323 RepID=UPI00203C64DC|nr:4Fe-4S dicluster domain-containing protein [Adlercreutzia aquisgranensis]
MTKQGFYFNMAACIGCRTCQIACKDKNDLAVGDTFRRLEDYEVGEFPSATVYHYSRTCNHCENPACVQVCPNSAMYISEEDGTVLHDDEKCIGCQYCVKACPYGVPTYIESLQLTHKCDGCLALRNAGESPACVASCPMRALEFGPFDELKSRHPDAVRDIAMLPSSSETEPCTLIGPRPVAVDSAGSEIWF